MRQLIYVLYAGLSSRSHSAPTDILAPTVICQHLLLIYLMLQPVLSSFIATATPSVTPTLPASWVPQAGPDPNTQAAADAAAAAAATAQQSDTAPADASLVAELAVLVLEHSSWFQPTHFATCSVALSSIGVVDVAVWDNLTAAAEHKVGAFTFPQLASMLDALAAAG